MTRMVRWSVLWLAACASQNGAAAPSEDAASTPPPDAAVVNGLPEVVATIGGTPVTRAQVMERGAAEIIAAEVAAHEARSQAIEGYIVNRLIDDEAARREISPDELISREVESKVAAPTDAEVADFYSDNKERIPGTLDSVRPQIEGHLREQAARERMRAFVGELRASAEVVSLLEPYRVSVGAADAPRWGSASAPIQIVEFSDFQCPYCGIGAETIDKVKEKYGDKVSVVYRHFPLPMHPQAPRAAEASACAHEQGKFWEFHDALFAEGKAWTDDDYKAIAKDLKLKKRPFAECLTSGRHAATVEADVQAGSQAGMQGTPGYYINGIVLGGAQPFERFVDVIDAELARL